MKILVPVDGSKYSMEAVKVASDYAKTKKADITAYYGHPVYSRA